MKKTICWDVDDVLQNFTYFWFKHYIQKQQAKFKKNKLEYRNLIENPPHKILKCKKEEYLLSIDHFAEHHYSFLIPDNDILNWFIKNGHKFNNIILTSCPLYRANISFTWVLKWFGQWIRSYNVVPSKRSNDQVILNSISKADFIKQNFKHVDYFIDDNAENLEDALLKLPDTRTYLIDKPWNGSILSVQQMLENLK